MYAGGFGDAKEADENVKKIATDMRQKVEEELGETFLKFKAVLYTTQVVAGTNYLIKVYVGHQKYIHIKVFVPLPFRNQPNELLNVEANKIFTDPLK